MNWASVCTRICIGVALGLGQVGFSQALEHSYQSSLTSSYTAVEHLSSGQWLLAGSHFFSSTFLRKVDTDGQTVGEWTVMVPDNEVTMIKDGIAQDDGSVILSGSVRPACDVGPDRGLVCLFQNDGVQWLRIYDAMGFNHAAKNDSLLVFASYNSLLFTDHMGDSLYTTALPSNMFPTRICSSDDGFVTMGYFGAQSVLADGTLTASLTGQQVHDMIQIPGGELLAVTADSLIELTDDLERTGNGVRIVGHQPRRITYLGGTVRVHTLDTLFSFNPELVELSAIPTDQPWAYTGVSDQRVGYEPVDIAFNEERMMTVGTCRTGVNNVACRTMPLNAFPDQLRTDAEAKNVTIDSLDYFVAGSIFIGTGWVKVWLHNHGDTTLTSVTLNHVSPNNLCGLNGDWQAYELVPLATGDSVELDFGPINLNRYLSTGVQDFDICVWVARPNHRIDREPLGNKTCVSVSINLTTDTDDESSSEDPMLFPNPVQGYVVLRPVRSVHGQIDLVFHDLQGRTALRNTVSYSGEALQVSLEGLRSGVYIVEMMHAGDRSTHRLVVE